MPEADSPTETLAASPLDPAVKAAMVDKEIGTLAANLMLVFSAPEAFRLAAQPAARLMLVVSALDVPTLKLPLAASLMLVNKEAEAEMLPLPLAANVVSLAAENNGQLKAKKFLSSSLEILKSSDSSAL